MQGRSLADQIGGFIVLAPEERAALDRLQDRERAVRRGAILVRENDRCTELFVLQRGLMMSYVLLDDGSRQILRFLFPGDVFGGAVLAYAKAPETLGALAESVVNPVDRSMLADLGRRHPRLLMAITALDQAERTMLTDRLAGVGRTTARARIAAVLLEVRDRLRRCDPGLGNTFTLALTQEEIGDATGLTAVHVNRMLRQLEEQAMIARAHGRVTLLDEPGLRRAANYVDRFGAMDLGWLRDGVAG